MNLDLLFKLLEQPPSDWPFPKSEIFNEGWMLRLLLTALQETQVDSLPFWVRKEVNWYSEASLRTFFPAAKGTTGGEGSTNADAVIGDFDRRENTTAGIQLRGDCREFVVLEAKMGSGLSKGTTYAPINDQAARTIACMAYELALAGIRPLNLEKFGFYVIAPADAKCREDCEKILEPEALKTKIGQRYQAYTAQLATRASVHDWWTRHAKDFLGLLTESSVRFVSWEECIIALAERAPESAAALKRFCSECLRAEGTPTETPM